MNWLDALKETAAEFDGSLVWGETDCCQFVNAYHERLTGTRFDFDYDTKAGALRILSEHGGCVGKLLTDLLGEPGELAPGAIVVTDTEDGPTAGVYNGYCIWSISTEEGLVRFIPEAGSEVMAWPLV